MGLPARFPSGPRHGDLARGRHHRAETAPEHPGRRRADPRLIALVALLLAAPAAADPLRLAFYQTELQREGPGLLLRDTLEGDARVDAVARIVAHAAPDVLVLGGIDWDLDGAALAAIAGRIAAAGHPMPHRFAGPPNTGLQTGHDLDGDGRLAEPEDGQGFGRFRGEGGLAVLSRLPIRVEAMQDFTAFLWRDLPQAIPPRAGDAPSPDAETFAAQRLATTAHWDLPVELSDGRLLRLLIVHATPPVFDGPEDRNGRRNHDEAAFWLRYLDGALPWPAPQGPLAVIGDANLDPVDGDGRPEALLSLLSHPRLQDPAPRSAGGVAAAMQGGANADQRGDPALDTADWSDTPGGPGNLRVDYILPSRDLQVLDAGVFWPAPDDPLAPLLGEGEAAASRHRLIWVDVEPKPGP